MYKNMFEVGPLDLRFDYLISSIKDKIDRANIDTSKLKQTIRLIDEDVDKIKRLGTKEMLESYKVGWVDNLEGYNYQLSRFSG
nr:MAG TPA: hypothetical protein [Caudoviricetes sp.]